MSADEFRRLALSLPEAAEASHMDHPDFRVRGKIFATLGYPADGWGMVKLIGSTWAGAGLGGGRKLTCRNSGEPRIFFSTCP